MLNLTLFTLYHYNKVQKRILKRPEGILSLFVGPLIPLFGTSDDVYPEFQSQGRSCVLYVPHIHLWCVTPVHLLAASMTANTPSPIYFFKHSDDRCRIRVKRIRFAKN